MELRYKKKKNQIEKSFEYLDPKNKLMPKFKTNWNNLSRSLGKSQNYLKEGRKQKINIVWGFPPVEIRWQPTKERKRSGAGECRVVTCFHSDQLI